MATATISYDGRNKTARSIMQMLHSLDIFTVTESQPQRKKDPTLMTKEEFFARVDEAAKGACAAMRPEEDLTTFLRRQGYAI